LKKKQHIDQWLKQSSMQVTDLPKAPVWDKIEATLDKNKRKKVWLWWAVASLFFVVAVGSIGYYVFVNKQLNINKIENRFVKDENNQQSNQTQSNDSKIPQSNSIDIENNSTENSDGSRVKKDEVGRINTANNNPGSSSTPKNINAKSNNINDSGSDEINLVKEDKNKLNEDRLVNYEPLVFKNRKPNLLNNNIGLEDLKISILPTVAIENMGKMKATLNKNSNIITFGLSAGFAPIKNNLSIDLNALRYVHMDYLGLRKTGETTNLNFSYGAYLRKDIRRFTFQLGFSYLTQGYHQNYDYLISKIPITNQFGTTPDKNGKYPLDEQTPYLTSRNPKNVTYSGNVINTNIDIPLNIGYKVIANKNWNLIPNIGMGLNIMQQSGATNTIDYQNLKLVNYNDLFVQKKQAYTFNAGIMIERRIYKSLNLTIQPYYHQFLSSNTYVVAQKTQQYGINLGLNLKWQKK